MVTYPGKIAVVPVLPRVTLRLREEDPGIGPWLSAHQDAVQRAVFRSRFLETLHLAICTQQRVVLLKHGGDEPLTAGVADADVGEEPIPVVRDEVVGQQVEPRVAGLAAHDVIAEGAHVAVGREGGQVGQRIEVRGASLYLKSIAAAAAAGYLALGDTRYPSPHRCRRSDAGRSSSGRRPAGVGMWTHHKSEETRGIRSR